MLNRFACGVLAVVVAGVLSGCSGDGDPPTLPSPTDVATTPDAPLAAPTEHLPAGDENVVVVWLEIAPASAGESAFTATIDQLSALGYDVAPMPVTCQDRVMLSLGLEDDPTAQGVAVVLDSFEASTAFSEVWEGDIVGAVDSPLLCDLPAR